MNVGWNMEALERKEDSRWVLRSLGQTGSVEGVLVSNNKLTASSSGRLEME